MTLVLPICNQPAERLIYNALIAAGREYDAYRYASQSWPVRDTEEAVAALRQLCEDVTIVWEEGGDSCV